MLLNTGNSRHSLRTAASKVNEWLNQSEKLTSFAESRVLLLSTRLNERSHSVRGRLGQCASFPLPAKQGEWSFVYRLSGRKLSRVYWVRNAYSRRSLAVYQGLRKRQLLRKWLLSFQCHTALVEAGDFEDIMHDWNYILCLGGLKSIFGSHAIRPSKPVTWLTRAWPGGGAFDAPLPNIRDSSKTNRAIDVKFGRPSHTTIWHGPWHFFLKSVGKFLRYGRFCDVTTRHFWSKIGQTSRVCGRRSF